jgi:hypothetical protein
MMILILSCFKSELEFANTFNFEIIVKCNVSQVTSDVTSLILLTLLWV